MLEVAVVNVYIIYKELVLKRGERPISHLAFCRRLIQSLAEPILSSATPRARTGPRATQHLECLQPVPHFLQKGRKRRDCVVCSDREGGTRHLSISAPPALTTPPCAHHHASKCIIRNGDIDSYC